MGPDGDHVELRIGIGGSGHGFVVRPSRLHVAECTCRRDARTTSTGGALIVEHQVGRFLRPNCQFARLRSVEFTTPSPFTSASRLRRVRPRSRVDVVPVGRVDRAVAVGVAEQAIEVAHAFRSVPLPSASSAQAVVAVARRGVAVAADALRAEIERRSRLPLTLALPARLTFTPLGAGQAVARQADTRPSAISSARPVGALEDQIDVADVRPLLHAAAARRS